MATPPALAHLGAMAIALPAHNTHVPISHIATSALPSPSHASTLSPQCTRIPFPKHPAHDPAAGPSNLNNICSAAAA